MSEMEAKREVAVEMEVIPPEARSAGLGELTEWETEHIRRTHGHCPDCLIGTFRKGPEGACSMNVQCERCGAEFNLGFGMGELLFAERIGEPD